MATDFLPHVGQKPEHEKHTPHHPKAEHEFEPPEMIAATEEEQEKQAADEAGRVVVMHHNNGKQRRSFKEWWKALGKKKQIIIIVILVVVVLLGGGATAYVVFKPKHKAPAPQQTATQGTTNNTPQPTTVASTLTGLPVAPDVNKRPVTGIMIENSVDARPQSGLNQAGVVFEAVAEGGITRFLTLFQDTQPDYIGPVRSVRPYYIQWAMGFDASIAHVGGSPEALNDMKSWGAKDLDQFANGSYYHRISSRVAPHNVYTSIAELNTLEGKKSFTSTNFTGFARKADAPSSSPNAKSIDFNISGATYNPHYDYDAASNSYKRSEGGKPHIDEKSGQQLSPKVVVALVMQQGIESDHIHSTYGTIGSGQMYVFQDGSVTQGTWSKDGNSNQFVFKDSGGNVLALNAGQTWISVVGSSDRVSYHP